MAQEEMAEEETPEATSPEYICGVTVLLKADGNGVEFHVMENEAILRRATLTDLNMMANHLADHSRSLMVIAQLENQAQKQKKLVKAVNPNFGLEKPH